MNGDVKLQTFTKVMNNQQNLRKKLRKLIERNRWIESEDERNEYYQLVAWATIGIGADDEYQSSWKDDIGEVYFQSYQRFFNKAAQVGENDDLIDDNGKPIFAEPEKIWRNVKDAFLDKKGNALREALRQSPERQERRSPKTKSF